MFWLTVSGHPNFSTCKTTRTPLYKPHRMSEIQKTLPIWVLIVSSEHWKETFRFSHGTGQIRAWSLWTLVFILTATTLATLPSSCVYCQRHLFIYLSSSLARLYFSREQPVWDHVTRVLRSFQMSSVYLSELLEMEWPSRVFLNLGKGPMFLLIPLHINQ